MFPGSKTCGGLGYVLPDGSISFDYNCDGKEQECLVYDHGGNCGGTGITGCTGSGWLKTNRPVTVNQDPFCGSNQYRVCFSASSAPCSGGIETGYQYVLCN